MQPPPKGGGKPAGGAAGHGWESAASEASGPFARRLETSEQREFIRSCIPQDGNAAASAAGRQRRPASGADAYCRVTVEVAVAVWLLNAAVAVTV
jgi:hypothetical protein